jgi:sugar-specific transcriptional regulator TrmB
MDLSGVHRQEIYPLINSLLGLGLIRKHFTKPLTYTATPFGEVAQQLLAKKTCKLNSLTAQTRQLAEQLQRSPHIQPPSTPCFGTLFGSEQTKKYRQAIADAQGSIEVVSSWVRFRQLCFHCESELKAALRRGVRIRVATEKPPRASSPKWLADFSAFELRTLAAAPPVALALFDGAEVVVASEPTTRLTSGPDLWSRHGGLVAVACGYFERLWAALK